MAAGRDLGAQRRVQRDGAVDGAGTHHLNLQEAPKHPTCRCLVHTHLTCSCAVPPVQHGICSYPILSPPSTSKPTTYFHAMCSSNTMHLFPPKHRYPLPFVPPTPLLHIARTPTTPTATNSHHSLALNYPQHPPTHVCTHPQDTAPCYNRTCPCPAHLHHILPVQHEIRVALKPPHIHGIRHQESEVGLQELVAVVGLGAGRAAVRRAAAAATRTRATSAALGAAAAGALEVE